ncbi:protein kinase [Streptomyces sp. NPDC093225]|uniref:protein kinase domain-containing protein n=1 Tax=Streptomyces sp. NPDC093225 TaxID=3366034 RepID=UPI00381560A1
MHPLDADEPRNIGGYRLLGRLGAGGMGRVYLGRSTGGRTVAIKIVHPHFALDEEFRTRFRREVAAARRVGGDWTAPVLDADPEAAVPWVATGYVAGPSLDRAVAAHGPLPEASVRAMGAGLAEALAAVHGLGLVHRDVKPSNVMLTLDGPRLIDFGIARASDGTASLTSTGVSIGSPGYMAPEQILGRGTTAAADVFSLGAVLAYAATGEPPYTGDNSATLLYKVVHEEPELGRVPGAGGLRELVAACLAKDPAARPAPAELSAALAPGGAAAGYVAGWLPPALVEEVSRTAVRLLDLEAGPAEPAGPAGPVHTAGGPLATGSAVAYGTGTPYGSAAEHAPATGAPGTRTPTPAGTPFAGAGPYGSGAGAVAAGGAYGPPDASYGPAYPATATGVPGPRTAGGTGGSADPAGTAAGAAEGAGGLTVSARAGRRVSCTVTLAVAAALAAVSLGGLYAMDLLPGRGARHDSASGSDASSPGATPGTRGPGTSGGDGDGTPDTPTTGPGTASPDTGAGSRDTVPAALTGTWKGTVKTNVGVRVQFEIAIRAGRTGDFVGRDVSGMDLLGTHFDCSGNWKLAKATDRSLVLDTSGGPNPHPGVCADGSPNERFTLNADGTLHYASGDAAAGNPEGDLTKQG